MRPYADAKEFEAPSGVVTVTIDPESGMPATPQCPMQQPEVFIAGTEPVGSCPLHGPKGGDRTTVTGWETPSSAQSPLPPGPPPYSGSSYSGPAVRRDNGGSPGAGIVRSAPSGTQVSPAPPDKPKRKGLFGRLKDIFR